MKRPLSILLALLLSFAGLAVLSGQFTLYGQSSRAFKSVDVATFAEAVADSTYIVLDVRTPAEYAEGHIVGTDFNIDVLESDFTQKALATLPKDKSVALYCRSGNRSKSAARILSENGYSVLELASGFKGWASAGKPIEK